jgi:hypothetical protein
MCRDCQAFPHYLGCAQEVLDENGGTEVIPFYPAHLKFTKGLENLKCVRLSDDGIIRWYAGCCKTPIANTVPSHKYPYAGVIHTILDFSGTSKTREEVLGPIYARVQGKYGLGKLPKNTFQNNSLRLIFRTIWFLFLGWIRKLNQPSPFFDSISGRPAVQPRILTDSDYENLLKLCGPRASVPPNFQS